MLLCRVSICAPLCICGGSSNHTGKEHILQDSREISQRTREDIDERQIEIECKEVFLQPELSAIGTVFQQKLSI